MTKECRFYFVAKMKESQKQSMNNKERRVRKSQVPVGPEPSLFYMPHPAHILLDLASVRWKAATRLVDANYKPERCRRSRWKILVEDAVIFRTEAGGICNLFYSFLFWPDAFLSQTQKYVSCRSDKFPLEAKSVVGPELRM